MRWVVLASLRLQECGLMATVLSAPSECRRAAAVVLPLPLLLLLPLPLLLLLLLLLLRSYCSSSILSSPLPLLLAMLLSVFCTVVVAFVTQLAIKAIHHVRDPTKKSQNLIRTTKPPTKHTTSHLPFRYPNGNMELSGNWLAGVGDMHACLCDMHACLCLVRFGQARSNTKEKIAFCCSKHVDHACGILLLHACKSHVESCCSTHVESLLLHACGILLLHEWILLLHTQRGLFVLNFVLEYHGPTHRNWDVAGWSGDGRR
jgi:hypothetical protein